MQRRLQWISMVVLASSFGLAQSGGLPDASAGPRPPSSKRNSNPQLGQRPNENEPFERRIEREREKQAAKDRLIRIKRDSGKLLVLATELRDYVDKTNVHVLSVEVIRKAEEIEKLAHSVKAMMKE